MIRRQLGTLALALAFPLAFTAATAHAQTTAYPAKPIRMIVPFVAGGGTDLLVQMRADVVDPDDEAAAGFRFCSRW